MSIHEDDERREYYRIEDTIALEFTLLPPADPAELAPTDNRPFLFSLLSDLHLMEFESQHLLRHISERDRTLANYLKVINKRIDLIGQTLAQTLLQDIAPLQQVTLSEGGIHFSSPTALTLETRLCMRLVLLPQALGLQLQARVVHCQTKDDNSYLIGCEFEALSEAQRQLLARHILQKQAHERRQARETENAPDL